ncbi:MULTISPECIES: cytochrome P450 [Mycobacteriaceae]|uniref:Cytochrome P450 n=1 Tax=Mycolicibacterium neoaurum VKM Ac-1815D TaxID=700508 RepID=V5XGW5_MYCNE|nr:MULTISPECIES: cytochrome P450 [Mycobacteriaceae]AHC26946.1 cytochrome P450 [Mycolicibacterium neoaurum VKM Ac-1815D]AMO07222.1 cytochrome P450 [Mycolicibacterium neoaurum]AXK74396.1 cytochrome P450 [Mycolicibacterium neoaurum]KJQ50064.1 cytochrome P450 [Mycolicibacterium neoaurum]KUM07008.1 cytochrome [Mycolicibacterium neoaurum]
MTFSADAAEIFGTDALHDPYPHYARMRGRAPVQRIGDSTFYAVCGWDAVVEAVARVEDFSSNLTATMVYHDDGRVTPFDMGPLGGPMHALATADDPAHDVHRTLLLPHLSARRIRVIEQFAEATAGRLYEDGQCGGRIEWMSMVANRLPMMVVARLLGLADGDVDTLIRLGYVTTTLLDGIVDAEQLEAAGVAAVQLSGYVLDHFTRAADGRAPGLVADLAARCAAGELEQFPALTIMITLFSAAGESTASILGSAAWILATHSAVQRQVRDNPELLGAFIEEVLRYESPFRGHYRHVRRDTELAGVHLPADSRLLLMWGAANRDPQHFDDPDVFRLDRREMKGHIAFGKGAHFCVGAALARLEARIVLRMLLERTAWIDAAEVGAWLPSILVRRLDHLTLAVR